MHKKRNALTQLRASAPNAKYNNDSTKHNQKHPKD